MKILKKERTAFIKAKLATSKVWAINALMKIYEFQTEEEQKFHTTVFHNKVGFTGADAEILTSFAQHYEKRKFLSPKQLVILQKKMKKYHNQILKVSDLHKLDNMILAERTKKIMQEI